MSVQTDTEMYQNDALRSDHSTFTKWTFQQLHLLKLLSTWVYPSHRKELASYLSNLIPNLFLNTIIFLQNLEAKNSNTYLHMTAMTLFYVEYTYY